MSIIEVDHVTKEYRLGASKALRQSLGNLGRRLTGRPVSRRANFKALDDVYFSIEAGEVIGFIGHNGAGKSTLLKLLSGITVPTKGRISVRGRVAPLIEVGTGLIGELTGRENVYLNGGILGMRQAEIRRKFDEIVAFAELEEFIDTPLKRYSSGMQVRLGFAVATAVDAEILIVDEVLAVGDLNFQRKCMDRMESLIVDQARTVLIVGHNIRQLERICKRLLLLDHGRIVLDGAPTTVANSYYERDEQRRSALAVEKGRQSHAAISSGVDVLSLEMLDPSTGHDVERVGLHSSIRFRLRIHATELIRELDIAIGFHTVDLLHVATFNTALLPFRVDLPRGEHVIECDVPDVLLMPGIYGVRIGVLDHAGRDLWYQENYRTLTVSAGDKSRARMPLQCVVDLPVNWRIPDYLTSPPVGRGRDGKQHEIVA